LTRVAIRRLLLAALLLLFVLHNDFWQWDDATPLWGLPVGLTYHIVYCIVAALVMWLLVRFAWPEELGSPPER
jgi:uncharacterized membrane protein